MEIGETLPSGRPLRVGRLVRYTHAGSGLFEVLGKVVSEEENWFNVRIPGYSILFPVHKDNRFNMVKDAFDDE